jgi:hypothetical protein
MRARGRKGYGWERWSSEWLYHRLGFAGRTLAGTNPLGGVFRPGLPAGGASGSVYTVFIAGDRPAAVPCRQLAL